MSNLLLVTARMEARFKYIPLPQGQWFRLLKLFPATSFEGKIECELIPTELDKAPDYEPISYAWGNANDIEEIICNSQFMSITTSLAGGLRRFRKFDKPRILWADGICIDQSNNEEKSKQVAFMSDIYRHGFCTLIWLGEDNHSCPETDGGCIQRTFDSIKRVNDYILSEYQKLDRSHDLDTLGHIRTIPPMTLHHCSDNDSELWNCIRHFFQRRWFSRCWVLGEVGLSRKAKTICGELWIDWSEVVLFIRTVGGTSMFSNQPLGVSKLGDMFIIYWSTLAKEGSWTMESEILRHMVDDCKSAHSLDKMAMLKVLWVARDFDATDDRDHIFAFLGHPALENLIEPSYSWSLEKTHQQLAQRILKSTESLDMLCFVQNTEKDITSSLSSWVPQWHRRKIYFGTPNSGWQVLEAAANETILEVSDNRLHAGALFIDCVGAHSKPLRADDFTEIISDGKEQIVQQLCSLYCTANSRGGSWEIFIWTLVLGAYEGHEVIERDFLEFCKRYCSVSFYDLAASHPYFQKSLANPSSVRSSAERFLQRAAINTHNRKFFIMKGHESCGLGPDILCTGDIVAAIFGCRMPLILRPTSIVGEYKLIGTCYVDELRMDDSNNFAAIGWRDGSISKQEIYLV